MWTLVFARRKLWNGKEPSSEMMVVAGSSLATDLDEPSLEWFMQVGSYPSPNLPERQLLNYSHFPREQTEASTAEGFVKDRTVSGG